MPLITIERIETSDYERGIMSGWCVRTEGRYADALSWDEMLGVVVALTMREGRRPCMQWLKTEAEHKAEAEHFAARMKEREATNAS